MLYKKFDEAVEQETEQSLPDSEKIVRLSEIFGLTSDCLLKGEESDPMDIYSQHSSKAGADMSAEVGEILEHVHHMRTGKRLAIGGVLLLVVLVLGYFLLTNL